MTLGRRTRPAFTLVEVAVSLAVLGMLIIVAVPAVQQARAAARRIQCANNLKEVGVAINNFATTREVFPAQGSESWRQLLDNMGLGTATDPQDEPALSCPDDRSGPGLSVSYVMNAGARFRLGDDYRNGYLPLMARRHVRDVRDGLSQTAAFSERLKVPYSISDYPDLLRDPLRLQWWTAREVPVVPGNEQEFTRVCQAERTVQAPIRIWYADIWTNGYDHFLPPNQPGCWNGPASSAGPDHAIAPASGLHTDGVNALFCDGHVTFVSQSIDIGVWLALGTINGSEADANGF